MTDRHAPLADSNTGELLAAIASKSPVPGGGAVAALVAGLGAALGEMVVAYSIGRRALADHAPLHETALRELAQLRQRTLELADEDARAYARLNELWRLDESDPRRAGFADAVRAAIAAPLEVARTAAATMALLARLLALPDGPVTTNRHLDSDLAMAAILAHAAGDAAAWNVRINLPQLESDAARAEYADAIAAIVAALQQRRTEIEVNLRSA